MLRNYFNTAFRHLRSNKVFSLINIFGLAIGIASFLVIALYVYHEKSYDRYHAKADRIFRIVENLRVGDDFLLQSNSAPPMGPAFAREFPEVTNFVRFMQNPYMVRKNGATFYEKEAYLADSTVFDVFSFKLISGNLKKALAAPQSVVLTQSTATKYFGDVDPLGQTLDLDGTLYSVTGVMADVPENSHFRFNLLVSFSTFSTANKQDEENGWFSNNCYTYLLLNQARDIDQLRAKIPPYIEKYIGDLSRRYKMVYEDLPLQPLTGIYLDVPRSQENGVRGSNSNLYILTFVAAFLVVIAGINYVNLTTARATRRIKEIGLRKILGARRGALIGQFVVESTLICLLSSAIALMIAWSLLPYFNHLVETSLNFNLVNTAPAWIILGAFSIALGILSGIYPALLMSGFEPLQVFRKYSGHSQGGVNLRKALVMVQFVVSISLVAGTWIVLQQLHFMRDFNLGYDKEATLVIDYNWNPKIGEHLKTVKEELKTIPGVQAVSASFGVPGEQLPNWGSGIEQEPGKLTGMSINVGLVDNQDFLNNYAIKIIAGRNFSEEFPADDTTAFIINEAAVRNLGWKSPETALGRKVVQREKKGTIIGVVQDFRYRSLHYKVEPLMIQINPYWCRKLSIKIRSSDLPATVSAIQSKWKTLADLPFEYSFLDQDYDRLYKGESQMGKLVIIFSAIALAVALLGLVGLTSFTVERRFREIAIRKVLGSSVNGIVTLVTREFISPIMVSFVLAVPLVYYLLNWWLENFTARIKPGPLTFAVAGLSVVLVAALVVVVLSRKAATANPVESLKQE